MRSVRRAGKRVLASRWARLAAALIDRLIEGILFTPLQLWARVHPDVPGLGRSLVVRALAWVVLDVALFAAVHGYFVVKAGQTLGKRWLGIQVVTMADGRPASFARYVVWRHLPLVLIPGTVTLAGYYLPTYGPWAFVKVLPSVAGMVLLIDALAIFRSSRRCVHDLIAGTRVVRIEPRVARIESSDPDPDASTL